MEEKKERKTDRRTLYTRGLIKSNFLSLLDSGRPVEKITVSELCRISEINRCTFYLHYADIYAVLEDLQREVQDRITECVNRSMADEEQRQDICAVLFSSMREDETFQVLRRHGLVAEIMRQSSDYSRELIVELCLETHQLSRREAELFALFVISGCLAVSEDQVMNHWSTFEQDSVFTTKILDRLYSLVDLQAINQAQQHKQQSSRSATS